MKFASTLGKATSYTLFTELQIACAAKGTPTKNVSMEGEEV